MWQKSEDLVERYLKSLELGSVVHEPDGNVSPDFLVADEIAVEVRRLNQNWADHSRTRGLEEDQLPLSNKLYRLIQELPWTDPSESWGLYFSFRRPILPWRQLKSLITHQLERFARGSNRNSFEVDLATNFEMRIRRAQKNNPKLSVLHGYSDRDEGGWVLAEMWENLTLCIAEKNEKCRRVRHKYPEWWFILPDHIGWGLKPDDQEVFRALDIPRTYDKIVLLDPRDHRRAFVL